LKELPWERKKVGIVIVLRFTLCNLFHVAHSCNNAIQTHFCDVAKPFWFKSKTFQTFNELKSFRANEREWQSLYLAIHTIIIGLYNELKESHENNKFILILLKKMPL